MQVAIGTIANRSEKQLDELLMDIFILYNGMAGTVCPYRINLLLMGMEGNMFQDSFQFALICRWICTVLGRYGCNTTACGSLCVCNSVRFYKYIKQNDS